MITTAQLEEFDALKGKLLVIEAELAERKRIYLVDGVQTPLAMRTTLEADAAKLRVQLHTMRREVRIAHEKAREEKSKAFLRLLIDECNREGVSHLVDRANRDSRAWITNQGMEAAYSAKVSA